jgi:hypothetical protein
MKLYLPSRTALVWRKLPESQGSRPEQRGASPV